MKTFKDYLNKIENFNESEKGYSRKGDIFSILDALSCGPDGKIADHIKTNENSLNEAWDLLDVSQKADMLELYLTHDKFSKERIKYSTGAEAYLKSEGLSD
jgi:hypothetical protein